MLELSSLRPGADLGRFLLGCDTPHKDPDKTRQNGCERVF